MSESIQSSTNLCPSCRRSNDSEMQFCLFCGAGLTPMAEMKRTQHPEVGRRCMQCGQADELNSKFCVFCSGKIIGPGEEGNDSRAFQKFSVELEKIEPPAPEKEESESPAVTVKPGRVGGGVALTVALALLGLLAGAGAALALGPAEFQKVWFKIGVLLPPSCPGHVPAGGLVIYTRNPFADVLVEGVDSGNYTAVKADRQGTACATRLEPGKRYRFRISAPGCRSVQSRQFTLNKDVTSVFGFQNPIELPSDK